MKYKNGVAAISISFSCFELRFLNHKKRYVWGEFRIFLSNFAGGYYAKK
ncbi:hypothetical protein HMPREF0663_11719 [Hoylesella oralis ATCC 33269]|uniref:Uncharacterized protein n=1 Tax=Hoylesella oralis ATCC 33269 TaxID=873533 RepID=E7RRB8_9BACT|nr:hypothetical protein HMPREF0663_11719 [Hoylesella oralis ATCC 33269]